MPSLSAYQHSKHINLLNQTIATDSTTSAVVDRLGYEYAEFSITMRAATATNSSAKWGVLKLMESDTTAVSDAANISGFIGTTNSTAATTATAAEFVIPAHNTTTAFGGTAQNAGQTIKLGVDCRGRKRYLFLVAQAAASHQTAVATADLYRGEDLPDSASERNVGIAVFG